jgi:Phage integrase family
LGRVVHFHSFRKTFQTIGVNCGINQRAAQEILGHSDANLTARVYTDVASLELHDEIAKMPWIFPGRTWAQHGAQNSGVLRHEVSLVDIRSQLVRAIKVIDEEAIGHALASADTPLHFSEMAARAGIEPATK